MNDAGFLLPLLCALLLAVLIAGFVLRGYLKRRLREIEGFRGKFRKKDVAGTALTLERAPKREAPEKKDGA